jgi:hypothetical protein
MRKLTSCGVSPNLQSMFSVFSTTSLTVSFEYSFWSLQAELLRKKLPWLQYDKKKTQYQVAKDKEKTTKQNLNQAAQIVQGLLQPLE